MSSFYKQAQLVQSEPISSRRKLPEQMLACEVLWRAYYDIVSALMGKSDVPGNIGVAKEIQWAASDARRWILSAKTGLYTFTWWVSVAFASQPQQADAMMSRLRALARAKSVEDYPHHIPVGPSKGEYRGSRPNQGRPKMPKYAKAFNASGKRQ